MISLDNLHGLKLNDPFMSTHNICESLELASLNKPYKEDQCHWVSSREYVEDIGNRFDCLFDYPTHITKRANKKPFSKAIRYNSSPVPLLII